MPDDMTKLVRELEKMTHGLDPAMRRRFFSTLPSIADSIFKTAQIIGPDPIESQSSSGTSSRSTAVCPHCGTALSISVAGK